MARSFDAAAYLQCTKHITNIPFLKLKCPESTKLYTNVTGITQLCYKGSTIVLQWCYMDIIGLVIWCYMGVAGYIHVVLST